MMLDNQFFLIEGKPTCDYCAEKLQPKPEKKDVQPSGNMMGGLLCGMIGAILGAILYATVAIVTGYEIGFVAMAVGMIVGWSVKKGAGGRGSRALQITAMILVYFSVVGGLIPAGLKQVYDAADTESKQKMQEMVNKVRGESTGGTIVAGFAVFLVTALIYPISGDLLGLLFIAIGMYEAWRICALKEEDADSGPVRVRAPAA